MRIQNPLSKAALFLTVAIAAACQSTTSKSIITDRPELTGLSPINAQLEIDTYFAAYPERRELLLTKEGTDHDGFSITHDNKVFFDGWGQNKPLDRLHDITSIKGNRICYARSGNAYAGCFDAYKKTDGRISIVWHLKSGGVIQYTVRDHRL